MKNSLTGELAGRILEKCALQQIKQGGKFKYCSLNLDGTRGVDETLLIPRSDVIRVANSVTGTELPRNVLYKPRSSRYPGIDAWIPTIGAFQVTVNLGHGLNEQICIDLPKLDHGGKHKLFWVVREKEYKKFKAVKPVGFEYDQLQQYVLALPNTTTSTPKLDIDDTISSDPPSAQNSNREAPIHHSANPIVSRCMTKKSTSKKEAKSTKRKACK